MKTLGQGLLLTALAGALLGWAWGRAALLPVMVFGAVATAIQVAAVALLRRGWNGTTTEAFKGFGQGMGLRLLGVGLLVAAILLDRDRFPPLPSALGFLGVLIPLLLFEVRSVR